MHAGVLKRRSFIVDLVVQHQCFRQSEAAENISSRDFCAKSTLLPAMKGMQMHPMRKFMMAYKLQ